MDKSEAMTGQTEPKTDREHRKRVLKGASILSGVNNSIVQCTIRNQHDHGALLVVPPEARIPTEFLLYVPVDGIGYHATVRWRKLDRCGVSFSGTSPKPSWLYG